MKQFFCVPCLSPAFDLVRLLPVLLLFQVSIATGIRAETVAEWKFDSGSDLPAGTVAKLDQSRKGASDESRLSDHAKIVAASTGISEKWKPFLSSGYLEAEAGGGIPETGMVEINKYGLYTQPNKPEVKNASYSSYFGFAGMGQGNTKESALKGGTVYLVLSPLDDFKEKVRYGFMGTGHTGDGEIQLGIATSGELTLKVGNREALMVNLKRKWKSRSWYFIAASWREEAQPILYVREMDSGGPAVSPTADVSILEIPVPQLPGPSYDPLVIGAHWFNPGAKPSSVYGAGSRIAYARFDNTFSTKETFQQVFESLGAP